MHSRRRIIRMGLLCCDTVRSSNWLRIFRRILHHLPSKKEKHHSQIGAYWKWVDIFLSYGPITHWTEGLDKWSECGVWGKKTENFHVEPKPDINGPTRICFTVLTELSRLYTWQGQRCLEVLACLVFLAYYACPTWYTLFALYSMLKAARCFFFFAGTPYRPPLPLARHTCGIAVTSCWVSVARTFSRGLWSSIIC
jgi:hypothetical protein